MTFGKYIDANLCCFIPGKIIDEIYNVLGILKTKCDPPSTYEVLQVREHSSQFQGMCSTKGSSEMLQNFPVFIDMDQGIYEGKNKVALNELYKTLQGFSYSPNISQILKHFTRSFHQA